MQEGKILNAICSICGKPYHVCRSCLEERTFKPWRTVTDSSDHYKIYAAIHKYTVTKNKERAKNDLSCCDLLELNNFIPEIKNVINEIMYSEKVSVSKKTNKNTLATENSHSD